MPGRRCPSSSGKRVGRGDVTIDHHQRVVTERLGRRLQWATIAWNSLEVFVTDRPRRRRRLPRAHCVRARLARRSVRLACRHLEHEPGRAGPPTESRHAEPSGLSASPSPSLPPSSWSPAPGSYASHEEPESSPIGIAYLFVTAVVMFSLARWKRRVGDGPRQRPISRRGVDDVPRRLPRHEHTHRARHSTCCLAGGGPTPPLRSSSAQSLLGRPATPAAKLGTSIPITHARADP